MLALTPFLGARGGGLSEAARGLGRALHAPGRFEVSVIAPENPGVSVEEAARWEPLELLTRPVRGPQRFAFMPGLEGTLQRRAADVVHVHGLWTYLSMAASRYARRAGRPYLVSPHGMLDGRALSRSRWRKAAARRLFEDRALEGAACLHAVSAAEAKAIRALGLRNPVCLIPNGVRVPPPSNGPVPWPEDARRDRVLLYLGRLHAKKGLASLLAAWERRPRDGEAARWRLVIAGWDDGEEGRLRRQAADLGLEGVFFAGPLHGAARDAAYSNAHAFVMPSTSEGLPLAPLEAWSQALPVLMTDECNLPEGLASGASLRITPDAGHTSGVLGGLFGMSDDARREMGARGRELVRRCFGWEAAAEEMRAVCRWVLGGGPPPASVSRS